MSPSRHDRLSWANPDAHLALAIRLTLQFYANHLLSQPKPRGSSHPQLILLTDDRANRTKAADIGLSASSTREYVDGLPDELKVKLSDLVATSSGDGHAPRGEMTKRIYADVSGRVEIGGKVSDCLAIVSTSSDIASWYPKGNLPPRVLQCRSLQLSGGLHLTLSAGKERSPDDLIHREPSVRLLMTRRFSWSEGKA